MDRYRWVEKLSTVGNLYQEIEDLMAFPNRFLNLAFYIYPNAKLAKNGEKMGGSAFWVSHKSAGGNDYLYAVTNAHVIEKIKNLGVEKCALRFNTTNGKTDIIETDVNLWVCHPDGDDIAIYSLNPSENWQTVHLSSDQFIIPDLVHGDFTTDEPPFHEFPKTVTKNDDEEKEEWLEARQVGIGDDTITIGRYQKHDGLKRNIPVMRFGHISMLPFDEEPILQDRPARPGFKQVSFLVETHSINGFSGSPVIVRTMARLRTRVTRADGTNASNGSRYGQNGLYLLGVDWGHFDFNGDIIDPDDPKKVKLPSGMMCVVPAWKLLELLNSKKLVEQRRKIDKKLKDGKEEGATTDSAITKDEFEAMLKEIDRQGVM